MAVNHRGALADHDFVNYRNDHEMAGRVEIGREAVRPYRFIEYRVGHSHHNSVIAGMKPSDFDVHCVNSPQSAHEF
jgi:hypothetical protein